MKSNELNDFLKQKEQEFEFPFEEKYWKQAEALLDQERRTGAAWWNLRNVGLSSLLLLMGGVAVWYALSHQPVSVDANSIVTNDQNAAPYFENNDNSGVGSHNDGASNVVTVNAPVNSTTNDFAVNENVINKSTPIQNLDTKSANTQIAKATKSIPVNPSIDNRGTTSANIHSVSKDKKSNLNSNKNTITPEPTLLDLKTDVAQIRNLKTPFISYRNRSEIPVFEQMTPDDVSLLKFYGLYYKSPSSTSKKIREFKYGAQYPQITFSAVSGLNIFNQVKQASDTNIYLGINPYLGAKICYQWSPVMMVSLQPMLMQRGGMNIYAIDPSIQFGKTPLYKHIYYLQLPLTIGIKLSKKNTVFAGGGVSIPLAAGYKWYDIEEAKTFGKYTIGQGFNTVDYFASLGYQFRLNKKISFHTSVNYGFNDVVQPPSFVNVRGNHNIQTSLGMTYQLYQNKLNLH